MKKTFLLFTLLFLFQQLCFSQIDNPWKDAEHYVGTSINYYPPLSPYSFQKTFNSSNGGAQIGIIDGNDVSSNFVRKEVINSMPSQVLNIAASYQIKSANSFFQEFSLARLAFHKSEMISTYNWFEKDDNGEDQIKIFEDGHTERSAIVSIRYEVGKYFQRSKKSKASFGLAASFQPSYYHYLGYPRRTNLFGFKANIVTLEMAIIPSLSFKLSKKILLDLKLVPNFYAGELGIARNQDPLIFAPDQIGERESESIDISLGGSIQVRYLFKEPEKRGRR